MMLARLFATAVSSASKESRCVQAPSAFVPSNALFIAAFMLVREIVSPAVIAAASDCAALCMADPVSSDVGTQNLLVAFVNRGPTPLPSSGYRGRALGLVELGEAINDARSGSIGCVERVMLEDDASDIGNLLGFGVVRDPWRPAL